MKKSYVSPAIEITEFKAEDIVRTSGGGLFNNQSTAASAGVDASSAGATVGGKSLASASVAGATFQFVE